MKFCKKITVTGKRQITLPAELCRELDIEKGDQLEVTLDDRGIRLEPLIEEKPLNECEGFLGLIGQTDTALDMEDRGHDEVIADEADPPSSD